MRTEPRTTLVYTIYYNTCVFISPYRQHKSIIQPYKTSTNKKHTEKYIHKAQLKTIKTDNRGPVPTAFEFRASLETWVWATIMWRRWCGHLSSNSSTVVRQFYRRRVAVGLTRLVLRLTLPLNDRCHSTATLPGRYHLTLVSWRYEINFFRRFIHSSSSLLQLT